MHRSGRTARSNKEGISVTLVSPADQKQFLKICDVLKKGKNRTVPTKNNIIIEVDNIPDFPVDIFYMPNVRDRVDLARKIESYDHKKKKVSILLFYVPSYTPSRKLQRNSG